MGDNDFLDGKKIIQGMSCDPFSGRTPPAPTIPILIQSKFVKTKARSKSNNFFLHFLMLKDD